MEFDKSKVYTALNADELKEGDKVLLADNLEDLKNQVEDDKTPIILAAIASEDQQFRFKNTADLWYALAYLVFSPPKPKYKPFSDSKTAMRTIAEHGGWIIFDGVYHLIKGLDVGCSCKNEVFVDDDWYSAEYIFNNCNFADDGSPVGVKVEDDIDNADF